MVAPPIGSDQAAGGAAAARQQRPDTDYKPFIESFFGFAPTEACSGQDSLLASPEPQQKVAEDDLFNDCFDAGDPEMACLKKQKDEEILATIAEITDASTDTDNLSSGSPASLPSREDPSARLQKECNLSREEAMEEAERKRELCSLLLEEMHQLQDRSARQYKEKSSLAQRLCDAKRVFDEKLGELRAAHEDLRGRIDSQCRANRQLRSEAEDSLQTVQNRAAEVSAQIQDGWESQLTLVRELDAAIDLQAKLQNDLREERFATWRQSEDIMRSFAQGSATTPTAISGLEVLTIPGAQHALASSSTRRLSDLKDKHHEDLNQMYLTEKSSWIEARDIQNREQGRLESACCKASRRINDLRKELKLEDYERSQLDRRLDNLDQQSLNGASARPRGLHGGGGGSTMPLSLPLTPPAGSVCSDGSQGRIGDFARAVRQAEAVWEEAEEAQAKLRALTEENDDVAKRFDAERERLSELQAGLQHDEAKKETKAKDLIEAKKNVTELHDRLSKVNAELLNNRLEQLREEAKAKRNQLHQMENGKAKGWSCLPRKSGPPPGARGAPTPSKGKAKGCRGGTSPFPPPPPANVGPLPQAKGKAKGKDRRSRDSSRGNIDASAAATPGGGGRGRPPGGGVGAQGRGGGGGGREQRGAAPGTTVASVGVFQPAASSTASSPPAGTMPLASSADRGQSSSSESRNDPRAGTHVKEITGAAPFSCGEVEQLVPAGRGSVAAALPPAMIARQPAPHRESWASGAEDTDFV